MDVRANGWRCEANGNTACELSLCVELCTQNLFFIYKNGNALTAKPFIPPPAIGESQNSSGSVHR